MGSLTRTITAFNWLSTTTILTWSARAINY
jgi:hypothetical protein